jgi:hypothetical protein
VAPLLVLLAGFSAALALAAPGSGQEPRPDPSAAPLAVSIEQSCPPPGILACHDALRITASVGNPPPPALRRTFRTALLAGLRAAGYRRLTYAPARGAGFAGRVVSEGETLARWRVTEGVLELATGGLRLRLATERR